MECVKCTGDIDHCHGTLIQHTEGFVECTDPACADFEQVRHTLVIECHEIEGGCLCVAAEFDEVLPRAS